MKRFSFLFVFMTTDIYSQRNWNAVQISAEKETKSVFVLLGVGKNTALALRDECVCLESALFQRVIDRIIEFIFKVSERLCI